MATPAIVELRRLRTSGIDDPERVVQVGRNVLDKGGFSAAGDEYWTIMDQIAVAALITGNDALAKDCIDRISAQFPKSPRTYALMGMQLEAEEKLTQAAEYYDLVLSEDQTNLMVWKRRIALLRSINRPTEAINQLTLLLDTFTNDVEGWAELADLYLSQDMLSQAAFCLEEYILLQPFSHHAHAQYAEVVWVQGKEATALKHWSRSVELCGDFLRGWFGVKTATKKILAGTGNGRDRGQNEEVELPTNETIKKLDLLATARLTELTSLATPAEKVALKALIGDVTTTTVL